jgi:hypothetical protein
LNDKVVAVSATSTATGAAGTGVLTTAGAKAMAPAPTTAAVPAARYERIEICMVFTVGEAPYQATAVSGGILRIT